MKYRIISVDYRSKFDKKFIEKNLIKSDKPYYIVQLVPNIDYAKRLLQLTKNCFTDPDTESSIKVIYEEEDNVCKPMDLTKEYTDLIEK